MRFQWFFLVVVLLAVAGRAYAQRQVPRNDEGEIEDAQIVIQKDKEITLPQKDRQYSQVDLPEPQERESNLQYSPQFFPYAAEPVYNKLQAAQLKDDGKEKLEKLYPFYLKGGGGNFGHTYFEAFAANKRSEKINYGIHLKHDAFANGPVDNSGQSLNQARLFGASHGKKYSLEGGLMYRRQRFNFYGYDPDEEVPAEDSLQQLFNTFGADLHLLTEPGLGKLRSEGDLQFRHSSNEDSTQEWEAYTRWENRYKVSGPYYARLDVDLSVSGLGDSSDRSRIQGNVAPQLEYQKEAFRARIGFRMGFENDTFQSEDDLHLYPVLDLEYRPSPQFMGFLRLDGETQKNTWRQQTQENPFLTSDARISHINRKLGLSGGLRWSPVAAFSTRLELQYDSYDNLPFYRNDPLEANRFQLVYDSAATDVFRPQLSLDYRPNESLELGLRGQYNLYTLNSLEVPFHRPQYELGFSANYDWQNKVFASTELSALGGIETSDLESTEPAATQTLPVILDLDLHVEYKVSKQFAVYLEGDNLLAQENARWQRYPMRGIRAEGGLKVAF